MVAKFRRGCLVGGLVLSLAAAGFVGCSGILPSQYGGTVNPPEQRIASGSMYRAFSMMWVPRVEPCTEQPGELTCLEDIAWDHVKSVMFGELHGYKVGFERISVAHDEEYVRAALPFLKEQGFNYLLLELEKDDPALADFLEGRITADEFHERLGLKYTALIPRAYVSMIEDAVSLGFNVLAIDATPEQGDDNWSPTEREMGTLANLTEIMEADPEARFVIFYGEAHIQECEEANLSYVRLLAEKTPPLGYLITQLLEGSGMENLTISLVNSGETEDYDMGIDIRWFLDK